MFVKFFLLPSKHDSNENTRVWLLWGKLDLLLFVSKHQFDNE